MSAIMTPADPRTRLAQLPQLRRWVIVPLLMVLATLILGFGVKLFPHLSGAEFRIDELLDRDHIAAGNAIALTINAVLSPPGIILVLLVLFAFVLIVHRSPVNAFAVSSVAAVGWLSSGAFKLIVEQPRPDAHLLLNPLVPSEGSGSFPSGHTAFAVAFGIAIYFLARGTRWAVWVAIIGLGFALLVAASRLYLGLHYLSDVLGSFLVATAAICFYTGLWNRYGMRILNRIPFLDRIGPIPSTDQPSGRRTTSPASAPDAR